MGLSAASKRLLRAGEDAALGVVRAVKKPLDMAVNRWVEGSKAVEASRNADVARIKATHGFSRK